MKEFRRILLCMVSAILISLNINSFVHTGGILPGGFSGLSVMIVNAAEKFSGVNLSYGLIYLLFNVFPILLSFRKLGKKFTIYSCINILLVSVLTTVFPYYAITYDPLLISVFGGIVNGLAVCLCLFANATSGGTDFISIFISEKYGIDAWNYIMAGNVVILILAGFLFGWDKALYSIIFQFVSVQIINTMYKHYKKNTLFIVTAYPHEIAEEIHKITEHGATEIEARGAYEEKPRTLIYSVVGSEELKQILKEIHRIDPNAFVNVIRTELLNGKFIMRPHD